MFVYGVCACMCARACVCICGTDSEQGDSPLYTKAKYFIRDLFLVSTKEKDICDFNYRICGWSCMCSTSHIETLMRVGACTVYVGTC